jgi:hypothetical protein
MAIGRLERTIGGELVVVEDAHEPLVDRGLWEAVNANRQQMRAPNRRPEPALLAGLVRCAGCGGPMSRGSGGRRRNAAGQIVVYEAYECLSRCGQAAKMSVPALNRFVLAQTLARLGRSAAVDASTKRTDEVAAGRLELDRCEHELAAYLAAVSAVEVGEAAFAQAARSRREAVDEARRQLAEAELAARQNGRTHQELLDWLPSAADEQANLTLRTLIREINVRKSGRPGRSGNPADRVAITWNIDDALKHPPAVSEHVGRKRKRATLEV